jgi:NADH-quinone oxidoreductase subunit I
MRVTRKPKLGLADRLYLPSILAGLAVTFRHMFRKKDTIQYPEEKHAFGPRYRGVPALVKDQDGREKCVACYMCQNPPPTVPLPPH